MQNAGDPGHQGHAQLGGRCAGAARADRPVQSVAVVHQRWR